MEKRLEQLLNSLIEKGWLPRWKDYAEVFVYDWIVRFERRFWADCIETFRTLTSKESWLWQFVCENGMVKRKRQWTNWQWWEPENCFDYTDYEYRLIESSLKDESELEDFLLDNIKIDEI